VTIRLSFHLSLALQLAEHAHGAHQHLPPAAANRRSGPALLLASDTNGVHLASNGLPPLPAPADQPGTAPVLLAFAAQGPPGTPWLEQVRLLSRETDLDEVLPLHEPAGDPLLGQLRAAAAAGHTTLTVVISGAGPHLAVSRRRRRSRPPLAP